MKILSVNQIIVEALHDPQNWENGEVKWNWVDSDLWLHPHSAHYSDSELCDGLNNFPMDLVPIWGKFTPRVTHPLP